MVIENPTKGRKVASPLAGDGHLTGTSPNATVIRKVAKNEREMTG
jgi:hypothetical protein